MTDRKFRSWYFAFLSGLTRVRYPCQSWGWLGPGGLPGLQNRWRVVMRAAVGSTPIHSCLLTTEAKWIRQLSA